jgi:putative ABC transport system ATP-binding protein
MSAILQARDIRKQFREGEATVEVLKGVSLALVRGEVVALEGPSGSGKTTLLSILGCLLTPTAGQVEIEGRTVDPAHADQLWKLRRRSIGFVFQQFNLFPALSAVENVEYALNIKGVRGTAARREAERMLDAVGMSERFEFRPRELSGGQKQRVAIARALAGDAPIILADEPTGNLDSQTGDQILALFRQLAKQEGRALLIVTHDPKVRRVADRVLTIEDGRISNPLTRGG